MVAGIGGKSGFRMVAGAVFGTFAGGETLVEVGLLIEVGLLVEVGFEPGPIAGGFQFDRGAATIGGFTAGERVGYVFFL